MSASRIERRLRGVLLGSAGFVCAATIVELLLIGHTENAFQWVPLALTALMLPLIGLGLFRPFRPALKTLKTLAFVMYLGSAVGLYKHLEDNIQFQMEIRPTAGVSQVLPHAVRGANPLLAPGILALAATLVLGGLYRHPELSPD